MLSLNKCLEDGKGKLEINVKHSGTDIFGVAWKMRTNGVFIQVL